MAQVSIPFTPSSKGMWQAQLLKELKENATLLQFDSRIEDISVLLTETEGPQLLSQNSKPTAWKRMVCASAENAKKSNHLLLEALMQGADAIYIEHATSNTDWTTLLQGVQTQYVQCLIDFETSAAFEHFSLTASQADNQNCIALHKTGSQQNFISTFDLQQIGANCSCQLGSGLFFLHQQLEQNCSSGKLYFEMGIGTDYFIEIAKFRALQYLVSQLEEIHELKIELVLIAKTGFCNKSLQDPYTNLLRLATEGLCAVLGGAQYICIQPYDALSTTGPSPFSQRMALNIGNLINEEAQLAVGNDPLQGAYLLEQLCLELVKKSWECCCELDQNESSAAQIITEKIQQTRKERLEQFNAKNMLLIGINAYLNAYESPTAQWGNLPVAMGLPYLIFEKHTN